MTIDNVVGIRRIGLAAGAAAAALAIGLASASPAAATQSPAAAVAGETLTVTGTNHADRIALRLQAGVAGTLQVDFGDDGSADFSFDRTTFSRIDVFALQGDDEFRIDQANGLFADETPTIDGGQGDDILNGGDAAEVFFGRNGRDAIDGNRGNDTGILGSGDDSFRWDPGDGSDIVEGERGFDTLDFNGAAGPENMRLSPNGDRSLFLRDAGNIRMDMDDVERLDLTTLGDRDTVTLDDMTGTDFRRADVDLSGPAGGGDGQPDTVTINGTERSDEVAVDADGTAVDITGLKTAVRLTGSETIDLLQVNTLDGNDDVDVDDDASALIGVAVDLGSDQR